MYTHTCIHVQHTHTHKSTHTHTHTYAHTHTHTRMHTRACIHMYTHTYKHTYTYACMHTHTHTHTHTYIYIIHAWIHAHTHTHTHTHRATHVCVWTLKQTLIKSKGWSEDGSFTSSLSKKLKRRHWNTEPQNTLKCCVFPQVKDHSHPIQNSALHRHRIFCHWTLTSYDMVSNLTAQTVISYICMWLYQQQW